MPNVATHDSRVRAAQGYIVATKVRGTAGAGGPPCVGCRHYAEVFAPRCGHGNFTVARNATCRLWVRAAKPQRPEGILSAPRSSNMR